AKKGFLEKPPPFDPMKEELEKIRIILQPKQPGKESDREKTVSLGRPADIAVDPRGIIYIIDKDDNTVKIIDQQGEYIGQLSDVKEPSSILCGKDGLYISDLKTHSILKYDFTGKFLYAFGTRGTAPGQFASVNDLALSPAGAVYVADSKQGLIHIFEVEQGPAYEAWQKLPPPSSITWIKEYPLKADTLAYSGKNILYAMDGKSIHKIIDDTVSTLALKEEILPVSAAADKDGFLWVLDGSAKQVTKLDPDGNIVGKSFQLSDKNLIRSSRPRDIAAGANGVIYVADSGNKWVWLQSFQPGTTPFSNVIRQDKEGNSLESPIALGLDRNQNLYVLDDQAFRVNVYSETGEPISGFQIKGKVDKPVDICLLADEIFVLDAGKGNIKVFDGEGALLREFGTKGTGNGDFKTPGGIAAKDDVTVFIADSGNRRIQVFELRNSPEMPAEFAVKSGIQSVEITWKPNKDKFPIDYRIYRSESWDPPYEFVGSSPGDKFIDRKVKAGRNYFYRISAAAKNGNESIVSNPLTANPSIYTPKAPKELKADPQEWSIELSWKSDDRDFVSQYVIYRQMGNQKYEIGKSVGPFYKVTSLSPNTEYAFIITAVSADGTEGAVATISTKTKVATKDPIEISVLEMQDIFSNAYKIYEDEWIGRIRVLNNSGDAISNLKISFMVKEYMDFASQVEIKDLDPGKTHEVFLKAIFNNKILDVTEDSPVQTEIKASYYWNNQPREFTRNHAVNIYEKHRMMWNTRERFAVFVTPKDPVVLEFTRSIATQYGKTESVIQRAAMIFNAISAMGITYLPDPNNPYQITSGKTDFVDYLQFPRETFKRKSGDCDDLVALYSSALESMGISTKPVEVPGHMLMMFSTDIETENSRDTMNGLLVIHQGKLWVPVETTLVGNSFRKAWEKGSAAFYQWEKNGLTTIDIRKAWQRFKPASLPAMDWRPEVMQRTSLETRFPGELDTLKNIELKLQTRKFYDILADKPDDAYSLNQIGIIYGKAGSVSDALTAFDKILIKDAGNVNALNNKANVLFISGKYDDASRFYEKAGALDPKDPLIWVNQARCYQHLNQLDKAKKAFRKAYDLDKNIAVQFRMMALELLGSQQ
ncbi:MAG: tetratricopeptide repeat protein, partial [Thermodesulfobacteriota bacterium]